MINNKSNTPSFKKNIFWNTSGNIIYLFSQWLITIIIVKITTYEIAGVYSLAVSITNVLYSIALYGIRNYQVSDIKNEYTDKEYLISRYITCIISLVICLFTILISSYDFEQKMAIFLYMLFHIEEAYIDVLHGIIQKRERMDYIGISCILRGITNLFLFSFVLYSTKNILLAIVTLIIITFIFINIYDMKKIKSFKNISDIYNIKHIFKLLKIGLPLAICTVLIAATPVVPRYYLEMIHGKADLGIYATIATPTVLVQSLITFLIVPIIPIISESYFMRDLKKIKTQIIKIFAFLFLICICCIIGAKILGNWILFLLLGTNSSTYNNLFISIIICTITTSFSLVINVFLTIMRKNTYILITNFVGVITSILVSQKLIIHYGIYGTSYAHIISFALQIFIGIFFIIKILLTLKGNTHYEEN